jgi:hypothetical protein
MRLRLLTSLVSPEGSWDEGDVYICDDEATARRLIASGQAVPFDVHGIELAVGEPGPERAVKPKGRRRNA